MGIKSFFGKGIATMLQAHQVEHNKAMGQTIGSPSPSTDMERMFGNCTPAVVAFRIDNGFVVRSVDTQTQVQYGEVRQSGFTYCKDYQEIAEHIIAAEAKRVIGIRTTLGPQQEAAKQRASQVSTSRI